MPSPLPRRRLRRSASDLPFLVFCHGDRSRVSVPVDGPSVTSHVAGTESHRLGRLRLFCARRASSRSGCSAAVACRCPRAAAIAAAAFSALAASPRRRTVPRRHRGRQAARIRRARARGRAVRHPARCSCWLLVARARCFTVVAVVRPARVLRRAVRGVALPRGAGSRRSWASTTWRRSDDVARRRARRAVRAASTARRPPLVAGIAGRHRRRARRCAREPARPLPRRRAVIALGVAASCAARAPSSSRWP